MQYYGLRMKKGTKKVDHLRKLDELADQLAAIVEEVKVVHKVACCFEMYRKRIPCL